MVGGKNFTGIASYLHQYYKFMDRNKVQYDFLCCRENSMKIKMHDPIFCNSKFYELNAVKKNSNSNDYFKIIREVRKILKKGQYDAVVVNTSVITIVMACILANFPRHVPYFIAHAHNTEIILKKSSVRRKISFIMNIFDKICRFIVNRYSSYLFACTVSAGECTFGRSAIKKKKFIIVKNAIDIRKFIYNVKTRNKIREEMGISSDTFVYGNDGQLNKVKNQKFLIEVFAEIHKKQRSSELWLIGDGVERESLLDLIEKLDLKNCVKMLGQRNDVDKLMQAMDCFVFTTLSEGLGIVAIEAQAAGLITIISDGVPNDVMITNLVHQLPLSGGSKMWAKEILKTIEKADIRRNTLSDIVKAGYDIHRAAGWMTNFYVSLKR